MRLRISASDGIPIYLQIVRQIRYLAAAGRLDAGEQLPPVRKLAEELVVNPNTVARAYRELETLGVITTRRGAGVYLSDGGSPLGVEARDRILEERIDQLVAEAKQMGIGITELARRLRQRHAEFKSGGTSEEQSDE